MGGEDPSFMESQKGCDDSRWNKVQNRLQILSGLKLRLSINTIRAVCLCGICQRTRSVICIRPGGVIVDRSKKCYISE